MSGVKFFRIPTGNNIYHVLKQLLTDVETPTLTEITDAGGSTGLVMCYPDMTILELLTQLPNIHSLKSILFRYELVNQHSIAGKEKDLLELMTKWSVEGYFVWIDDYLEWERISKLNIDVAGIPPRCVNEAVFKAYKDFRRWFYRRSFPIGSRGMLQHINVRNLLDNESDILTLTESYVGDYRSVIIKCSGNMSPQSRYKLLNKLMIENYIVVFECHPLPHQYIWTSGMSQIQKMNNWPEGKVWFTHFLLRDRCRENDGFRLNDFGLLMVYKLIKEAVTTKMLISESSVRERLDDSRVSYIGIGNEFRVGDYQKKVMTNLNDLLLELEIVKKT